MINRLNVRVYGLLEFDQKILLVQESIEDFSFTKFPGGGLELGEGIRDCLIREFKEETGLDVEVTDHIYTTDFFQQSAFRKTDQLIAIYYKVTALGDPASIRLDEFEQDDNGKMERLRFFWVSSSELNESLVTFPIDKLVCRMIQEKLKMKG